MEKGKYGGVKGDQGDEGLSPGNDGFKNADNGNARFGTEECTDQTGRATDMDSPESNK